MYCNAYALHCSATRARRARIVLLPVHPAPRMVKRWQNLAAELWWQYLLTRIALRDYTWRHINAGVNAREPMSMSEQPGLQARKHESLQRAFAQLFEAINVCLEKRLRSPALILLYSAIDIASWLCSDDPGVRARFTTWVKKYVLPGTTLKCNAVDLYGARCGLAHTYSAVSDLSARGEARPLGYAFKPDCVEDLEKLVDTGAKLKIDPSKSFVPVQFEDLFEALREGIVASLNELRLDSSRAAKAYAKAESIFVDLTTEDGAEMLRLGRDVLGEE